MSELNELYTMLKNADAAAEGGDAQAAQDAQEIARMIGDLEGPALAPGIRAKEPPTLESDLPQGGSIANPLAQGLTLGFADEIEGFGRAATNKVANLFGGGTDESFGETYRRSRDAVRGGDAAFSQRNPKTALAAEVAGGALTGGLGAARAGAVATARNAPGLAKLAGIGAAEGGVYGAGASEQEDAQGLLNDTAQGAALGGVIGAGAPAVLGAVGKVGKKFLGIKPLSSLDRANIQALEDAGIQLTAGQRAGAESVRALEATLKDVPIAGSPLANAVDTQRGQFQRKIMEMAGFADEDLQEALVTPEAIQRAYGKFSTQYTDKLQGVRVNLGPRFVGKLRSVKRKFNSALAGGPNAQFNKIIDAVGRRSARGTLTGKAYQKLRSEIGDFERSAGNQPRTQALYREVKKELDKAFSDAAGATNSAELKGLNRRYAQLKQIDKLEARNAGGSGGIASGMVPISQLASLAQKSPGSREWKNLTRAGQSILIDSVPNSGTAQRTAALSAGSGFLGALVGGNPVLAGKLAAGAGATNLASRALANPKPVGAAAGLLGRQITNAGLLSAAPASQMLSVEPLAQQ